MTEKDLPSLTEEEMERLRLKALGQAMVSLPSKSPLMQEYMERLDRQQKSQQTQPQETPAPSEPQQHKRRGGRRPGAGRKPKQPGV